MDNNIIKNFLIEFFLSHPCIQITWKTDTKGPI